MKNLKKEKSTFSKRLIKIRKSKGLTQDDLAAGLDLPRHKIAYFETKAKNPTADSLHLLADFFKVPIGYFIDEETADAKKSGPDSELEYRLKKLRQLPRSQQKTVIAMLDGLLQNFEG